MSELRKGAHEQAYAPQYPAPEADVGHGFVRVRTRDGQEEIRQVLVGQTNRAWEMWAAEMRFSLLNTAFIDLGGTVYRAETIDRIDPVRDRIGDPTQEALQVALGALTVIESGEVDGPKARDLAHEILAALAEQGVHLVPLTELSPATFARPMPEP